MKLSDIAYSRLAVAVQPLEVRLMALFRETLGRVAVEVFEKNTRKEAKELVSEVDFAADKIIAPVLEKALPGVPIISEEGKGTWPPTTDQFWLVDPLDGTQNFLAGMPIFGAMIALIRDGFPVFVACFLPAWRAFGLPTMIYAGKGQGAFWDTWPIMVSVQRSLKDAFLIIEGPSRATDGMPFIQRLTKAVARRRMNLSMVWSGALIASGGNVARGVDLLVSGGNGPWDNLPIDLLVEEAGGTVTDWDGNPPSLTNYANRVYSNGHLHSQVLALAQEGA